MQALIGGNLGNQLFQYAFAKQMATDYSEDLNVVFRSKWKNQLKDFKISDVNYSSKLKLNLWQWIILIFFIFIRFIFAGKNSIKQTKIETKWLKFLSKNGIFFYSHGYIEFPKSSAKYKVTIGYFESSKYFERVKEEIINQIVPKYKELDSNKKLYETIDNKNSVAISIRRGDFVKLGNIICDKKYFINAIKIIKELVINPKFIIFSDDIEWVKNNMHDVFKNLDVYYENGNDPIWEKLRLLYRCKHFIISNSTFSFWGSYLSKNAKKIIIAPKKWRNYDMKIDIYEKEWYLI